MRHALKKTLIPAAALILLAAFMAVYSPEGYAGSRNGISFADNIKVDGKNLTLHGIGLLKWKYLVNVYLVGLYKPNDIPVDRILEDIPKRLEYYFFVDMKASDFQETGFDLMAQNVGREKAEELLPELEKFNSFYRDVKEGQRYSFTYLPDKGLEMALDGETLGVVQNSNFAAAYLAIWLGPDPVSKNLQEGMFDPSTNTK